MPQVNCDCGYSYSDKVKWTLVMHNQSQKHKFFEKHGFSFRDLYKHLSADEIKTIQEMRKRHDKEKDDYVESLLQSRRDAPLAD